MISIIDLKGVSGDQIKNVKATAGKVNELAQKFMEYEQTARGLKDHDVIHQKGVTGTDGTLKINHEQQQELKNIFNAIKGIFEISVSPATPPLPTPPPPLPAQSSSPEGLDTGAFSGSEKAKGVRQSKAAGTAKREEEKAELTKKRQAAEEQRAALKQEIEERADKSIGEKKSPKEKYQAALNAFSSDSTHSTSTSVIGYLEDKLVSEMRPLEIQEYLNSGDETKIIKALKHISFVKECIAADQIRLKKANPAQKEAFNNKIEKAQRFIKILELLAQKVVQEASTSPPTTS